MPKKLDAANGSAEPAIDIEALNVDFLKCLYDQRNRQKAAALAVRLDRALVESPKLAESIRGEEIRSLIAEQRGDLPSAISAREAEIRKILELHTLAVNTPNWKYIQRQYDFADVSDRLDLLAILADKAGDRVRALATLRESRRYCESHGIEFDGKDVLAELESAPTGSIRIRPKA